MSDATLIPVRLARSPLDFCQNDGAKAFMGYHADGDSEDDRFRVGTIDSQTPFKRGTGHKSECAKREATVDEIIRRYNSHTDLLEALTGIVAAMDTGDRTPAEMLLMERGRAAIAKATTP